MIRRLLLSCLALLAMLAGSASAAELRAGALATIEWEHFGVAPPAHAEEWEVFLSIDGGRTYPIRLTPHLDLAVRAFTFEVPDLPTREARLLLRMGDERDESEVEAPWRLAILPGRSSSLLPRDVAFARGESARPSDPGVVFWIEGERDGSGLREVAAALPPSSLRSVAAGRRPWLLLFGGTRVQAPAPRALPQAGVWSFAVPQETPEEPPAPASAPSVRLLIHRFNE